MINPLRFFRVHGQTHEVPLATLIALLLPSSRSNGAPLRLSRRGIQPLEYTSMRTGAFWALPAVWVPYVEHRPDAALRR